MEPSGWFLLPSQTKKKKPSSGFKSAEYPFNPCVKCQPNSCLGAAKVPHMNSGICAQSCRRQELGEPLLPSRARPHSSCLLIERLAGCAACTGLWDLLPMNSMSPGGSGGVLDGVFSSPTLAPLIKETRVISPHDLFLPCYLEESRFSCTQPTAHSPQRPPLPSEEEVQEPSGID